MDTPYKQTTVGILGAGQLARMMALSGYPLGLNFLFYDPEPTACAGQVGDLMTADYDNQIALDEFCRKVDVVTLDFENVPVDTLRFVQKRKPVFPDPDVLEIAQDRLLEKNFISEIGIPVAEYFSVDSHSELMFAAKRCDYDAFLKTRRLGYDGKGQYRIKQQADVNQLDEADFKQPMVIERAVDFEREVSVIIVRNTNGESATWPLCENKHKNGILTTTIAPAKTLDNDEVAFDYAQRIADALNYVGVLVVEFFQTKDGFLVNEIAPRVHNSGHWTIEGAYTSQFENHLRAGLGLNFGPTGSPGVAAMINWIGAFPQDVNSITDKDLYWHIYGKAPREGRKIGHCTLLAESPQQLHSRILSLVKQLGVSL
ncbi:5-(carboxyamino)imidazole ribonucleotide synthase [Marinicella sp. W31]|uniref:5-(carboxyamino)imidazole ribonucleotide synthase n=1 Tax=Marinicella sp. W31 TaxID=3023713 RepID=UPI003757A029